MDILNRSVLLLRNWMKENGYDAFIVPSTDPHCGEYVPEHWEARKWISGFTGSAGTAVVTATHAALWTDSRYFLQAEEQLKDTYYILMKERMPNTPSIAEWLLSELPPQSRVALNGEVCPIGYVTELQQQLTPQLEVVSSADPFDLIWEDRPQLPMDLVVEQPIIYAGKRTTEKIKAILSELYRTATEAMLLCALDEIAWVTNLRGTDIHCNPFFVSYLLIGKEKATLYINREKVTDEIAQSLNEAGIGLADYAQLFSNIASLHSILLDPSKTNYAVFEALDASCRVVWKESCVTLMKAVKNEAEINGFHAAMLRDGVAMVKFLKWLRSAVEAGGQTELSVTAQLEAFRSQLPLYQGISFDTIAGYNAHGAIVHYEADTETDAPLNPQGFLLLDSGGQYTDGTTDITRTIPLGALTDEMKVDYTLVLKGFIQLGLAVFPEGTTGTQLDVLARQAMWRQGKNYGHGTGHGVGSHLCVHEGPHQIRMNHMPTPLQAGMTVTDEPGLYITGHYGIRTENTLLVVPCQQTAFGSFLQFEHLTLCPISTSPIVLSMLTDEEVDWLNGYHQQVYQKLAPYLNEEEKVWLSKATQSI